jgi:hypothetical protein
MSESFKIQNILTHNKENIFLKVWRYQRSNKKSRRKSRQYKGYHINKWPAKHYTEIKTKNYTTRTPQIPGVYGSIRISCSCSNLSPTRVLVGFELINLSSVLWTFGSFPLEHYIFCVCVSLQIFLSFII